jgi:bifunctional N-acetylglucosamine-1-phosphate-uridyltransferase/glucosamine-1-phosphate-acetyltransferase GlmU-like protein
VLEWALRLEKDGILGEGMALTKEEKHLASSITYNVHVEHMSNSQFQQGTQHSTQILEASRDLEKVNELLQLLKGSLDKMRLDSQKRSELEAEIGTIETQLASPKPKGTIIREAGRSIRNILEGAAGSSLATAIGNQLPLLLQILQNWPT